MRDADRGVERARDDDGQPGLLDDGEGTADAAERLRLDHEQVGGAGLGDRERVLRAAHALVGRDRDAHVLGAAADLGEFLDGRARLLDVLEVELGEGVHGVLGLVDVPAAVGVDADPALRAERLAHRAHAGDVVRRASGRLAATLTFAVRHPGKRASTAGHLGGIDGGDRRVHGDARSRSDRRRRLPAEVDGGAQPGGRLGVVVLDEGRELGPPLRALEQHGLAHGDPAEAGDQGRVTTRAWASRSRRAPAAATGSCA